MESSLPSLRTLLRLFTTAFIVGFTAVTLYLLCINHYTAFIIVTTILISLIVAVLTVRSL